MSDEKFKVESPLGYTVVCSKTRWEEHIEPRHYVMAKNEAAVKEAILDPIVVYESNKSPIRHVYFGCSSSATYSHTHLTKVIVIQSSETEASLVTTFPIDKIRGGINERRVLYEKEAEK